MSRPDLAFDMVRPGIAVYGLSPIPERGQMGLIPAMTLRCPVALVKSVNAGDGVSYGHTWVADRDTTLALLPIGYADGVYRALSGRFEVMINGRRRPQCRPGVSWTRTSSSTSARAKPVCAKAIRRPSSAGHQRGADRTGVGRPAQARNIRCEVVTSPRGRVTRVYREGGTIE